MQDKYIELLIKRCLKVKRDVPLFISYKKINRDFVDKIVLFAKKMGVKDIYLDETDSLIQHDILKNTLIKDLSKYEMFNCHIWDEYAKKDAAFLMLESEIPKLMDDIDSKKIAEVTKLKRTTKPLYLKRQLNNEIAWCIACIPNEYWAKELFPKSKNPLKDFWYVLGSICMLDKKDPIKCWDDLLKKQARQKKTK